MGDFFAKYFIINEATGLVEITWPVITVLVIAGFLVGIINTIAGSGTVITYSLFMFLGVPANMANGTIRIGVIMQTLAASLTFKQKGYLPAKKGFYLAIPVILGTLLGAQIAAHLSKDIFELVLAGVMLLMLFFVFYEPQKWIEGQVHKVKQGLGFTQFAVFFVVGLYGGFIHIGVGIFLLATLVLNAGYNLVKANALKVFIVFLYSPFALLIFFLNDQVYWEYGLISAFGNLLGGIVASRLAIKKGATFVRWFLVAVIILFTARLIIF